MICNNVINTCGSLARLRPKNCERYFELAIAYSQVLVDNVARCSDLDENESFRTMMEEKGHRGLIFSRMNLLLASPGRFRNLAPLIWADINHYETFARRCDDADLRAHAADLKRRVYTSLKEIDKRWTADQIGVLEFKNAADAMENLSARIESARSRAVAAIRPLLENIGRERAALHSTTSIAALVIH
jgi:hypothetical protein